ECVHQFARARQVARTEAGTTRRTCSTAPLISFCDPHRRFSALPLLTENTICLFRAPRRSHRPQLRSALGALGRRADRVAERADRTYPSASQRPSAEPLSASSADSTTESGR